MATLVNYLLNQPLNRKNTLKQVTAVLIKACFPLLVFNLATKLIHKSNSEEGLYAVGRRGGGGIIRCIFCLVFGLSREKITDSQYWIF